jgi:hypothetical protein
MNMPGHWRVMTVSHALRQVVLLDPLGDEFTIPEFDNVKYSYSGYNVSTWTKRLQTDGWNCGVWDGVDSIIMDNPSTSNEDSRAP